MSACISDRLRLILSCSFSMSSFILSEAVAMPVSFAFIPWTALRSLPILSMIPHMLAVSISFLLSLCKLKSVLALATLYSDLELQTPSSHRYDAVTQKL